MVFFKRIITTATVLAMSLTAVSAGAQSEAPFTDIDGSFATESIISIHNKGFIEGVTENTFAPQAAIQRKHFAQMIAKAVGIQPIDPVEPTFTDVAKGSAEYGYIEALVTLGVVQGTGGNLFQGETPIQRQDAAVILAQVLTKTLQTTPQASEPTLFKDEANVRSYAKESTQRMSAWSLMNGYQQHFSPEQSLTRAESAVIGYKVYDLVYEPQEIRTLSGMEFNVGESKKIPLPPTIVHVSYQPVWGWDNPESGSLTADGTFTAQAAGKGLITLNLGNKAYQIPVEVIGTEPTIEENKETELEPEKEAEVEQNPDEEQETELDVEVDEDVKEEQA